MTRMETTIRAMSEAEMRAEYRASITGDAVFDVIACRSRYALEAEARRRGIKTIYYSERPTVAGSRKGKSK